jgi:hypothetical protein
VLVDGNVCGAPADAGLVAGTPDGGGNPELRNGGDPDGRRLGGCGRMLGGGGGVRAPCAASCTGKLGCVSRGTSCGGVAGRERIGGGGGPEGFAKAAGDDIGEDGVGGAGRDGAGGEALCERAGGDGVMPGSVMRGACGSADEAGRGGANEGRGGTAEPALAWDSGSSSLECGFSLISPLRIAKIDAEKKPGILRET